MASGHSHILPHVVHLTKSYSHPIYHHPVPPLPCFLTDGVKHLYAPWVCAVALAPQSHTDTALPLWCRTNLRALRQDNLLKACKVQSGPCTEHYLLKQGMMFNLMYIEKSVANSSQLLANENFACLNFVVINGHIFHFSLISPLNHLTPFCYPFVPSWSTFSQYL